jgi:hypothetical protein
MKTYQDEQAKLQLSQRLHKIHNADGPREGWDARPNEQVCDNQQPEDREGADSHRPGEADFFHELRDHDGEDDAAQRGAAGCDAEGEGTLLEEPCRHTVEGRIETHGRAKCAANTLREEELVVFG